jgi:hypothetical protein
VAYCARDLEIEFSSDKPWSVIALKRAVGTQSQREAEAAKSKPAEVCTLEEAATIDFKPEAPEVVEAFQKFATWEGINNPHLVQLRVATKISEKDKPGLVKMCRDLAGTPVPRDGSFSGKRTDLLQDLHERFDYTAGAFRAAAEFLEKADLRLLVASSAMVVADEAAEPGRKQLG